MKKAILFFILVFNIGYLSTAQVVLSPIFTDNMVLQRNRPIPIWGNSNDNETVEIRFNKQIKIVKADENGKWMVKLNPEIAGGPYQLIVEGKNTLQLNNILVGDVWICSGQSNMEWTVGQSQNAKEEISSANNPLIRHVKIAKEINSLPQDTFATNSWQVCDSTTVADFSGIGYFFAKKMVDDLNIPIGLINASWGGTNIETWISRDGFENSDEFREMITTMPQIDLDTIAKLKTIARLKKIESVQNSKLNSSKTDSFKERTFDDSNWPELNQPQAWEQQNLGVFDGIVWLRKTFVLSEDDLKKKAILYLAKIDDEDISYVNGIKIGSSNQWDHFRKYEIPDAVLKEGKNAIAIRVVDTGGDGGIYGNPEDLKLIIGGFVVPLNGQWKYQVESIKTTLNVNEFPSLAYNAMINPLIPFAFRGVLWYQGESNADRAFQYRTAFPLLINDWRAKFDQGNFPFYFVQLATFKTTGNSNEGCSWAELREAQTLTLQIPNTGMVVTTDIGDPNDIHPTNKQDVGKRLAALALNKIYHQKIISQGPSFKSMKIKKNQLILSFHHTRNELTTHDESAFVNGFEIAGNDQVFHPALATVKANKILVSAKNVKNPIATRFGWIGDASANNLFNKEGFPAVPFRTDHWKTITKNNKYSIDKLLIVD
jgi:sialate O-acetylesterase